SVAWATERRDVLSALLFLTCVLTYLRAASAESAGRWRLLTVSIVAFALSMLAKSIVMTLPLLLIVLDWYPLRRLSPVPSAWYAIMLAPVGGLVHAGFQLAHDRYSYLSCLGFAVLVGGGVAWLVGAHASGRLRPPHFRASCAALGVLLTTLAALTWLQVQVWRDSESLWTHAMLVTPECSICHDNYGAAIVNRERKDPSDA